MSDNTMDGVASHADQRALIEAAEAADEQGLLFNDDLAVLPDDLGYRGPTACAAAGITYRQLDYKRPQMPAIRERAADLVARLDAL